MDTTNSNETPGRRVEDRKPNAKIDWTAPGAPAVPMAAAAAAAPVAVFEGYDGDTGAPIFKLLGTVEPGARLYRTAPAATSGDAPVDIETLKEQSEAWFAVCDVLRELDPDWTSRGEHGMASAVSAIRRLAAAPATASGDELPVERINEIGLGLRIQAFENAAYRSARGQAMTEPEKAEHAGLVAFARAAVSAATKPTNQEPVAWAVVEGGKRVYVSCNKRAAEDWLPYSIARELVELYDHPAATKPTVDAESAWKQYAAARTPLMDTSANRSIFVAGYSAAATKPTADTETLKQVCDLLHIGELARTPSVILTNIVNLIRRENCLGAVERAFFMAPAEKDEDFPDEDPGTECVLSWGASPSEYVEQLRAALLATKPTACALPPTGWTCTRAPGHEGPCAAVPTEVCADDYTPEQMVIYQHGVEDGKLVARGMERYKAGIAAREAASTPAASTTGAAQTAEQVRDQALEEAARHCESAELLFDVAELMQRTKKDLTAITANMLAEGIRSLKRPTPTHSSEAGDA